MTWHLPKLIFQRSGLFLSPLRARETRKARSDAPEARHRRDAGPTLEEETETTTLVDMIEDMSSLTGDE